MNEYNQNQDSGQINQIGNADYQSSIVSKPEATNSYQVPSPTQSPKPERKHKAVCMLLCAIILVAGGAATYIYLHNSNVLLTSSSNINLDSTEKTIAAVTSLIVNKYPAAEVNNRGQVKAPFYKPVGSSYSVYASKFTDLFIDSATDTNSEPDNLNTANNIVLADIKSFLLKNGFKMSFTVYPEDNNLTPILISSTVLCEASSIGVGNESSTPESITNFTCSDLANYDSVVKDVAPFSQIDKINNPSIYLSLEIYNPPIIKNSATSGYQIASVFSTSSPFLAGGGSSVYYKKGSGSWVYFTTTYNSSMTTGDQGSCQSWPDESNPFDSMTADEVAAFNGITSCSLLYDFSMDR